MSLDAPGSAPAPQTPNAVRQPSIARSVFWNYLGAGYEALAGLVLAGYVVRHIAVAEYGLLLLAMSLCGMMFLLDLGLSNILVPACVAAAKDSSQKLSGLLSTAFVVLTGMGAVGLLVFVGIALNLPGPFRIPQAYLRESFPGFVLVVIATQTGFPTIALECAYQAFHRYDRINQIQFVTVTVRIVLTIVLLAAGYGVIALAFIQTVLSLVRLLGLWIGLPWSVPGARLYARGFDWKLLKPLMGRGRWALLENCGQPNRDISDSLILGIFGSLNSVALFGLGGKLPAQLSNAVAKGAIVILPSLSKHHADADGRQFRDVYLNAQRLVFTGALPGWRSVACAHGL